MLLFLQEDHNLQQKEFLIQRDLLREEEQLEAMIELQQLGDPTHQALGLEIILLDLMINIFVNIN